MEFEGAVIKEQGVMFAIVVVKQTVLNNNSEAARFVVNLQRQVFGEIPVILMAQNTRGVPTYYGRQDIVRFLAGVPMQAIPWKRYSFA